MPVTRSVAALASTPHALFEALLRGDSVAALRLLEAKATRGRDPRLVFPIGNFSVLHAAALGGCAAAIPALVAAGAPLDASLQLPFLWRLDEYRSLRNLLDACGHQLGSWNRHTALDLAVRSKHASCVRQLLEQGADPTCGNDGALLAAVSLGFADPGAGQQLLLPFVQHGVDPLAPVPGLSSSSLLTRCSPATAALLLADLEQQRAAGTLQLGSAQRAAELVVAVARFAEAECHLPLVRHAIAALEQLLGLAGGGQLAAADAELLRSMLSGVLYGGQPAVLKALLASRLPFDLPQPWQGMSWVYRAAVALRGNAAACVRLLHQAGAPLSAADLYAAIDHLDCHEQLSATSVTALLACGMPAVDWATERPVSQILEALWAAGYRPTVYRQARLPAFLYPVEGAPTFAELDPLALYDAEHPQHAQLDSLIRVYMPPPVSSLLLFLARTGGAWSPAAHHNWPLAFKQAAGTLLLCAAAGSRAAGGLQRVTRAAASRRPQRTPSEAARLLSAVPPDVLLHVVKQAAEPLSSWLD